jgi:hypothetical protein
VKCINKCIIEVKIKMFNFYSETEDSFLSQNMKHSLLLTIQSSTNSLLAISRRVYHEPVYHQIMSETTVLYYCLHYNWSPHLITHITETLKATKPHLPSSLSFVVVKA